MTLQGKNLLFESGEWTAAKRVLLAKLESLPELSYAEYARSEKKEKRR